jgi:hypothetical protein
MQATADSRIERVKDTGVAIRFCRVPRFTREFPSKVISKCPAIRLAVSRTHSVIGRITLLVNSIRTMNDIKATGVPWGRRWDSM